MAIIILPIDTLRIVSEMRQAPISEARNASRPAVDPVLVQRMGWTK